MKVKDQKKLVQYELEQEQLIQDLGYRRATCHPRFRELEKLIQKLK